MATPEEIARALVDDFDKYFVAYGDYDGYTDTDALARDIAAALREERERYADAADVMLAAAQTIRIQQVQATAEWDDVYRSRADDAWATLNRAHRSLVE